MWLQSDEEGRAHVLRFWEGSIENSELYTSLLSDLVGRGLDATGYLHVSGYSTLNIAGA